MARTKGSEDLYQLIHSLTREERGYFTKFSTRHSEGSVYLDIFNAIHRQTKFEEETLKKKFKNYTVLKVYLFDSILQSLMVYRQSKDVKMKLLYQYIYMDILLEKKLQARALQLAKKGALKAQEAEIFSLQYEFLRTQHLLEKNTWASSDFIKNTKTHFALTQHLFKQALNAESYRYTDSVLFYFDYAQLKVDSTYGNFEQLVDPSVLKDEKNVFSRNAERNRLASLARYYALTGQEQERCHVFEKMYKFENDLFKQGKPLANKIVRLLALWGTISALIETHQIVKAEQFLDQEWLYETPKSGSIAEQLYYIYFKASIYWAAGKHKQGEKFMEESYSKLDYDKYGDSYHDAFGEIAKLRVLFAYSNNNLQKAFLYINEIQAMGGKKQAPVYYKDGEILKALIQVKLGNYDIMRQLLTNILKSSSKYGLQPIEKSILPLFKKMTEVNKKTILKSIGALVEATGKDEGPMGALRWACIHENLATGKAIAEMIIF